MSEEVKMPQMGESIAEGTIVRWLKQVGDSVRRDEPLFEISTDKVDAEIPAPSAGVLSEILVKEGETVPINTVVAVINGGAAKAAPAAEPAGEAAAAKPEPPPAAPAAPVEEKAASPAPPAAPAQEKAAPPAQPAAPAETPPAVPEAPTSSKEELR